MQQYRIFSAIGELVPTFNGIANLLMNQQVHCKGATFFRNKTDH